MFARTLNRQLKQTAILKNQDQNPQSQSAIPDPKSKIEPGVAEGRGGGPSNPQSQIEMMFNPKLNIERFESARNYRKSIIHL